MKCSPRALSQYRAVLVYPCRYWVSIGHSFSRRDSQTLKDKATQLFLSRKEWSSRNAIQQCSLKQCSDQILVSKMFRRTVPKKCRIVYDHFFRVGTSSWKGRQRPGDLWKYVSKQKVNFFQEETRLAYRGGRGNYMWRRLLHEWRWTSLVESVRLFLFLLSMSKDATSVFCFGECIQKRCELLTNLLLSIRQIIWEKQNMKSYLFNKTQGTLFTWMFLQVQIWYPSQQLRKGSKFVN